MPYKDYEEHKAAQRRWYARNKEHAGDKQRRKKVRKADGRAKPDVCDVCAQPSWRIVFDHCHTSGKFRGWVCWPCNIALGHVKDNPAVLRALADYLERSGSATQ